MWPQESSVSYSFHGDVRCGGGDDDDARFRFLRWRGVFLLPCLLLPNKQIFCGLGLALVAWARFWVGLALLFPEGFWEEKGSSLLYGSFLFFKVKYIWVLNGVFFSLSLPLS